jgi:hypothetical protein
LLWAWRTWCFSSIQSVWILPINAIVSSDTKTTRAKQSISHQISTVQSVISIPITYLKFAMLTALAFWTPKTRTQLYQNYFNCCQNSILKRDHYRSQRTPYWVIRSRITSTHMHHPAYSWFTMYNHVSFSCITKKQSRLVIGALFFEFQKKIILISDCFYDRNGLGMNVRQLTAPKTKSIRTTRQKRLM